MPIRHSRCSIVLALNWVSTKHWDGQYDITHDAMARIRTDFMLIRDLPGATPVSLAGSDKLYSLAERFLAQMPSEPGNSSREVRRIAITHMTSMPMFDIELGYWSNLVEYRGRVVGWTEDSMLFTVELDAPALFYFNRDVPSFEATIGSVCARRSH